MATIIEATNATMIIANLTIVIEMINAMITLDATTKTQRAPSPMTRRMITNAITSRNAN
jgi:hypothetical protein